MSRRNQKKVIYIRPVDGYTPKRNDTIWFIGVEDTQNIITNFQGIIIGHCFHRNGDIYNWCKGAYRIRKQPTEMYPYFYKCHIVSK